ncbi:MAG: hypothetical protein M3P84_01975 [Chloroflexota bacterium]|nr:hypothetical protein [Chloroflexota bacterium]
MSKRHQSSRRRSYGRRQHELRERTERGQLVREDELDHQAVDTEQDAFSFLDFDLAARRMTFALGD